MRRHTKFLERQKELSLKEPSLRKEPTYIQFVDAGYSSSGKTRVWEVTAKENKYDVIGEVRWFASWRCYAFYPYDKTVFEKSCLRDIANFCEEKTNIHKKREVGV